MLFAPGSVPKLLERVFEAGADSVILDLEDAVALNAKQEARGLVAATIERRPTTPAVPLFVRVNALATGMLSDDLAAVVHPRLTGIKLPKVESADDLRACDAFLADLERSRGIPVGSIAVMAGIESAAGVEAAFDIAQAATRLWCLSFGAEDFAADIGADPSPGAVESLYARSRLVIASRASRIAPPFDSVYPHLDRPSGLARNARSGRRLGFQGKSVIHPSQLATVHEIYGPSESQVAWAERVLDAFAREEAKGVAAFRLDGSLIDYAMVRRAEHVLRIRESARAHVD
jgi:citrate lyase subunit beta/citryl-CoA lyase